MSDELIRKGDAEAAATANIEDSDSPNGRFVGGEILAAIRTLPAVPPNRHAYQVGVAVGRATLPKVKPLVWLPSPDGMSDSFSAKVSFGAYFVRFDDETNAWFASLEIGEFDDPLILDPSDVATSEAAKAAAQRDYEARILSALEPADASQKGGDANDHSNSHTRPDTSPGVTAGAVCDPLSDPRVKALVDALRFYRDGFIHKRDGFIHKMSRTKLGVIKGSGWVPTESLLDDCGNKADTALRQFGGEA